MTSTVPLPREVENSTLLTKHHKLSRIFKNDAVSNFRFDCFFSWYSVSEVDLVS